MAISTIRIDAKLTRMAVRYKKMQKRYKVLEQKRLTSISKIREAKLKKRKLKLGTRMDTLVKRMKALVAKKNSVRHLQLKDPKRKRRGVKQHVAKKSAPKAVTPAKAKSTAKVPAKKAAAPKAGTLDKFGKDTALKAKDIPKEMYDRIARAAHRTFDAIGGDLLSLVQSEGGNAMKQGEVIESVFDASRMDMYGGDKEAAAYMETMHWDEVMKLGKKIFPYKMYS